MPDASSAFHDDELKAQHFAGQLAAGTSIRSYMPDQHRTFFEGLSYLFLATRDANGWPIATMLAGQAGFLRSPSPVALRITAALDYRDPAASTLAAGREVGLLGLDLATRRRNRANGFIAERDGDVLTVEVLQSFGNCAKYIQRRALEVASTDCGLVESLVRLDREATDLIAGADTFFVASRSRSDVGAAGGLDVSHRGGRPGFIEVASDAITVPDYPGNGYYNTLGNLLGEPRASLLFMDFTSGDLLQLQGVAEINWNGSQLTEGTQRSWRFTVIRGWRRRAAHPLRWRFLDYSPATLKMGTNRPAIE